MSVDIEGFFDYFPEYYLAQWFFDTRNEDVMIWCFEKTGARPLIKNYRALVKHLEIDCIILVDGGADSLMHGDEPNMGTLFEDALSLLAINELKNVPLKLMASLGIGVEYEIDYAHLFENIAQLIKQKSFLGTCSLIAEMSSYQEYQDAVLYVFDKQPEHPSVICSSVISATNGDYGDVHLIKRTQDSQSELRISPLMSQYWFFDATAVAKANLLIPAMRLSTSVDEAYQAMQHQRQQLPVRPIASPPLP